MSLHEVTTSTRMETVNRQHKTYSTDIWNMTFLKQRVQKANSAKLIF